MDLVKETLTCKVCNNILKQPVFLPCHKTLCQTHINMNESILNCFFCHEPHIIPAEGFKPNEMARNLISSNTHLSEHERTLKVKINESLERLQSMYDEFMNKEPHLKALNFEHFTQIRDDINAQRDALKRDIDIMADTMLKQTEMFEFTCKEKLKLVKLDTLALNKDRFRRIADELEDEFQRTSLNMLAIEALNAEIKQKSEHIGDKLNEYNEISERISESSFEKPPQLATQLHKEFGYLSLIDANKMISCSSDKTIRVWNQSKSECKTLLGHTGSVFCILLIDNGLDLVSGSFDKTMKIWSINTGECKKTLENTSYIYCLNQLTSDLVISGCEDGSLQVWNFNDGTCQTIIYAHASLVTSIEVISSQSELILSSSTDTTIKMWDLKSDICLKILSGHTDFVFCMRLLNDRQFLATGSNDNSIKIWNLKSGVCVSTIEDAHTECVNNLQVLSMNSLVSCSDDFSIKIWNITNMECIQTLLGHSNIVICVRVLSVNKLASGSRDNTIKIWDLVTGECLQTIEEHEKSVNCILFGSSV